VNREEAERERARLAEEHPEATWLLKEAEDGWQVLRVGIPSVDGRPTGTSVTSTPRPERPDTPPAPDKQQVNPNWGF
jgi:hypothetical protein